MRSGEEYCGGGGNQPVMRIVITQPPESDVMSESDDVIKDNIPSEIKVDT